MFKTCKIIMLPTEEESNIFLKSNKELEYNEKHPIHGINSLNWKYQHLYIISNDKIKENTNIFNEGLNGDWFYNTKYKSIARIGDITSFDFKIIASTDLSLNQDVIARPYPLVYKIPQSFIQQFIEEYNKGNIITDIMVEYDTLNKGYNTIEDIPFEEYNILKINSNDNTVVIKRTKDSWNREEMLNLLNECWDEAYNQAIAAEMNGCCDITKEQWIKQYL